MEFRIINKDDQVRRSFRITLGLEEGYGKGTLHTLEEVGTIVARWLDEQRSVNKPYLPGCITPTTIHYWGRSLGKPVAEPTVFYEGEVSPEHSGNLSDAEVIKTLQELCTLFAKNFRQSRVYFYYRDIYQILSFD